MKKMKSIMAVIAMMVVVVNTLTGCGKTAPIAEEHDDRIKVVTSVFPYYDLVRAVAGEYVDLTLVIPAGMDTHSFEPTLTDLIKIEEADLLVYNGGEGEYWIEEVLVSNPKASKNVLCMMDYIALLESDHAHEEEAGHHHGSEEEIYDEHIWTSPLNMEDMLEKVCDLLVALDAEHEKEYKQNAAAYKQELDELDDDIRTLVLEAVRKKVVFGDRFPFAYFAAAYGLDYEAAYPGCSTETEPSIATISELIDLVKEEDIPVVYHIELSNKRTAEVIAEETGCAVLELHSAQTISKADFDADVTYVQLMRRNLENLEKGLK